MTTLTDFTIPKSARRQLLQHLPGLSDKPHLWKLLGHIALPTYTDQDSGRPLLSYEQARDISGNHAAYDAGHAIIRPLLEEFSANVFKVEGKNALYGDYFDPKDRRVTELHCEIPQAVQQIFNEIAFKVTQKGDVALSTGNLWSNTSEKALRDEQHKQAIKVNELNASPEQQRLIRYLNSLSPAGFRRMATKKLHEALEIAKRRDKDAYKQVAILRRIATQPKAFYTAPKKSARIFASASVVNVAREIRDKLTCGWIGADLKSAQLAIVARLWRVEPLIDALTNGQSVWRYWLDLIGDDLCGTNKKHLKQLIYSVCFGMGKRNLKRFCIDHLGEQAWKSLNNDPIFSALLKARAVALKDVEKAGFVKDAFGATHKLETKGTPREGWQRTNAPSLLALQAQSYELKIMLSVLDVAESKEAQDGKKGMTIVTWLHDGFCFSVRDQSRREQWIEKLRSAVSRGAKALGIPTELEITFDNTASSEAKTAEIAEHSNNTIDSYYLVPLFQVQNHCNFPPEIGDFPPLQYNDDGSITENWEGINDTKSEIKKHEKSNNTNSRSASLK